MAGIINESGTRRAFLLAMFLAAFGALFLMLYKDPEEFAYHFAPRPIVMPSKHDKNIESTENLDRRTTINRTDKKTATVRQINYLITKTTNALHDARKARVMSVCGKYGLNTSTAVNVNLMYADKYKLAYRNIPKIGSTFLTQMFAVIVRGVDEKDQIFGLKRMNVHMQTKGLYRHLGGADLRGALTMIPTRNPYTRLYSAYIDKVYLPLAYSLAAAASRFGPKSACGVNTTFESFLRLALRPGASKPMGDHFSSPFGVTRFVCQLDNFMLVKQESFSSDVEYALQKVGVQKDDWDVIHGALHDHRVEVTVPGIVATIYTRAKSVPRTCFPWSLVAYRTWHSFQLQGFISYKNDFPRGKYFKKPQLYEDADYLIHLILDTIKKEPLSSIQSKQQRKEAFMSEYENVDLKLISDIKSQYAMDFEVYDYDPSWRNAL